MANKTVENPCAGSGRYIKGEITTLPNGIMKALCSECDILVTYNKKTKVARKHSFPVVNMSGVTADIDSVVVSQTSPDEEEVEPSDDLATEVTVVSN